MAHACMHAVGVFPWRCSARVVVSCVGAHLCAAAMQPCRRGRRVSVASAMCRAVMRRDGGACVDGRLQCCLGGGADEADGVICRCHRVQVRGKLTTMPAACLTHCTRFADATATCTSPSCSNTCTTIHTLTHSSLLPNPPAAAPTDTLLPGHGLPLLLPPLAVHAVQPTQLPGRPASSRAAASTAATCGAGAGCCSTDCNACCC